MRKPVLPDWVLTRKFALAASLAVHAGIFAFVLLDRGDQKSQAEVVIEFAPSDRVVPPEPVAKKVVDIRGDEHAVHENVGVRPEPKPARRAAPRAAMDALLAMDLSGLRADVVRAGLKPDGPDIQAAGFAPLEPSIHLTDSEVDSLVAEEREGAKVSRKRGIKGIEREPAACFPPRR